MSRQTRIAICRTLFLAVCLLPLVGTISYAAWQRWTTDDSQASQRIVGRLGFDAEVQQLRHSRPGVTTAESCKLFDPETNKLVAHCDDVQITTGSGGCAIAIRSAYVPHQQIMSLWSALHDRLLRHSRDLNQPLIVAIDRIACRDQEGEVELGGFRLECHRTEHGSHAQVSFRPDDHEPHQRSVRISMLRDLRVDPPATRIDVQSPDKSLDCSLIAGSPRWLRQVGSAVRFQGHAWLESHNGTWQAELTGRIHGVQLDRVVDDRFPFELTGNAALDIEQAVFQRGRVVVLEGRLTAGPGVVSRQLLAAQQVLGMRAAANRSTPDADVLEYDSLAMMFHLSSEGIMVRGLCEPRADGVVMTHGSAPILIDGGSNRYAVDRIITALTGVTASQAIFTEAGEALWRVLPLTEKKE